MHNGFTKAKQSFLPHHAYPMYNIQSSSNGQNNIVTSEIETNPFLSQNCK